MSLGSTEWQKPIICQACNKNENWSGALEIISNQNLLTQTYQNKTQNKTQWKI